jgi:hypothetical protein
MSVFITQHDFAANAILAYPDPVIVGSRVSLKSPYKPNFTFKKANLYTNRPDSQHGRLRLFLPL